MKRVTRCGLFVVDLQRQKTIILQRRCPYDIDRRYWQRGSAFIEQFCVPRGACINSHESVFACGVREFIEECGFFFKAFTKCPYTFTLEWEDPETVLWQYRISFIQVNLEDIIIPMENKIGALVSHIMQMVDLAGDEKDQLNVLLDDNVLTEVIDTNANFHHTADIFDLKAEFLSMKSRFRKIRNTEFVHAVVTNIQTYISLLNIQKTLYISSNYAEFISFIQTYNKH